ncbi:MAG: DedA family protein [Candidatus Latescibacterota bacterium]
MNLETIILTYGYPALFLGVFFEGETVLILAGFLVNRGYMYLPLVIIIALFAAFLYTQLFFLLGRRGKNSFIEKKPVRQLRAKQIRTLLEMHQNLFLIGFRFLYGFRTITPFVIGVSGYSPNRFVTLNVIGAIAWAVTYGVAGYLFGHFLGMVLADLKKYEWWMILAIVLVGSCLWLVHRAVTRLRMKKQGFGLTNNT